LSPTASQEIRHLESHVQEALDGHRAGRPDALRAIRRIHPRFKGTTLEAVKKASFARRDARLVVALEHGFPSWNALRKEAQKGPKARWNLPVEERIPDAGLKRALRRVDAGDVRGLAKLLRDEPSLAKRQVDVEPSGPLARVGLLELAAASYQRQKKVPPGLVESLTKILNTAKPPRSSLRRALWVAVSGPWKNHESSQRSVIRLLIAHGADPKKAMARAIFQGGVVAIDELVRNGGPVDLVVAASAGRVTDVRRLLAASSMLERRRALALAAVNGQTAAVRTLLDSGLSPSGWNPRGFYDHSTPLHQAVWFDHPDTVRLLVERGADLTVRDKAHDGTPLGWAVYGKRGRIARYLRSRGARTTPEL